MLHVSLVLQVKAIKSPFYETVGPIVVNPIGGTIRRGFEFPLLEDLSPEAPWTKNVETAYQYWLSKVSPGRLPGRACIDPVEIPRLLSGIWLLDVSRSPFRFKYRLIGTSIVSARGFDPTGRWLDEAHAHLRENTNFFARYERVAEKKIASRRTSRASLWSHNDYRTIENVLLPLATDGSQVDIIMIYTALFRLDGSCV
jgi:hypothetical protein